MTESSNERKPALSRRAFLAGTVAAAGIVLASCTPRHPPMPSSRPTKTASPLPTPKKPGWQSRLLSVRDADRLEYHEVDGARLPDFGAAGYRGGGADLPRIDVVRTIRPVKGDNSRNIQQAIDEVAAMGLRRAGFRGAVQLEPGVYPVAETIVIGASGIVLRGSGSAEDSSVGSTLLPTGDLRDVVRVGKGGSWSGEKSGTRTEIVSELVPIGSTTVRVKSPGRLRPGDQVVIAHPATASWLRSVKGGGTGRDADWSGEDMALEYLRTIREVEGSDLILDSPLYVPLDRALSPNHLYAWDEAGLVSFAGVEDLRIKIDSERAQNGIRLSNAQDCWVRDCVVTGFVKAGIVTITTTRTTIDGCRSLNPGGSDVGGQRYNFNAEKRSQQILFTSCQASHARHSFIVNGAATASGIVFHRTSATESMRASEGHRRWSQGILFDNHVEHDPVTDRAVLLGSRGDYGTGHGWSSVNSVAWATDAASAGITVQRPPSAQNFAIGCFGDVSGDGPFSEPTGYIEGTGKPRLQPPSLYEAQRAAHQDS